MGSNDTGWKRYRNRHFTYRCFRYSHLFCAGFCCLVARMINVSVLFFPSIHMGKINEWNFPLTQVKAVLNTVFTAVGLFFCSWWKQALQKFIMYGDAIKTTACKNWITLQFGTETSYCKLHWCLVIFTNYSRRSQCPSSHRSWQSSPWLWE